MRAGKRPGIGVIRLGAEEAWREHHLPADDKAIEAEMVAEKLPAPRLGFRWDAEQTKCIGPFAEHRRPADEIAEEAIEPHDAAGDVIAFAAQARAHHRHHRIRGSARLFVEPQAVMLDIKLGVLPMPPQLRSRPAGTLRRAARRVSSASRASDGFDHCGRRRILRRKRKQAGLNIAVGRYSLKRRGGKFRPGSKQLMRARTAHARLRMRARRRTGDVALSRRRNEAMIVLGAHG